MAKFTGLTAKTAENLLLGAGAFFKDFDIGTDTYETALADGKIIGATSGGGSFIATPQMTTHAVDGAPENTVGLTFLDSWTVSLGAKVVEVTEDTIKAALGAGKITIGEEYTTITGKTMLEESDYFENITFVGRLAKTTKPIIIQVYNAMHSEGISLSFEDKGKGLIEFTFNGNYKVDDVETPPFDIHYPKGAVMKNA